MWLYSFLFSSRKELFEIHRINLDQTRTLSQVAQDVFNLRVRMDDIEGSLRSVVEVRKGILETVRQTLCDECPVRLLPSEVGKNDESD